MTVFSYLTLKKWAGAGGLTPYDPACINPASVDLRWSGRLLLERAGMVTMEQDVLLMQPGDFRLVDTLETIAMPPDAAGRLVMKSSFGRQGLGLLSGWFDPGYVGTATLQIVNHSKEDILITKDQRIVQLVLFHLDGVPEPYNGRYQYAAEPAAAEVDLEYQEFVTTFRGS